MRPLHTPSRITKIALSATVGGTVLVGLAVGSASANPLSEIVHHVPFLDTVLGTDSGAGPDTVDPTAGGPVADAPAVPITSSEPASTDNSSDSGAAPTTVATAPTRPTETTETNETTAPTAPPEATLATGPEHHSGEVSTPTTSIVVAPDHHADETPTTDSVPTTAPASHEEKKIPTVVEMRCTKNAEPAAVTCSWSGAMPEGASILRLGRGESANRGRVVWQTTEVTSTTAIDAAPLEAPAPYLLMIFAADGTYLGHSNPVQA